MAKTYEPISTQTLGTAPTTVTFSSIPQTYTDLVLVFNSKSTTLNYPYLTVNSDTGANYSRTYLAGSGSAATSGRQINPSFIYLSGDAGHDASNFNYLNIIYLKLQVLKF